MLKKLLPVGIGILLIIIIAVTISVIDNVNSRTPSFDKADKVYVSYKDYDITYDNLYTLMKNQYGATELLNLVDEKLYAEEIKEVDVESAEFMKFVNKQVFGNEDLTLVSKEDCEKAWADVISSLRLTGLINAEQAADKDYTNTSSSVWSVIKDYYKLPYARNEWAKKAYLDKYLKEKGNGDKLFFDTKEDNKTDSIETYYEDNYTGNVVALFIPFTSEESALAMMKKHGINTLDKVFDLTSPTSNSKYKGWVKDSYDYYGKENPEESDMFTYDEVVKTFFDMYNEIYSYLNDDKDIITSENYTRVLKEAYTAELIADAVQVALDQTGYGMQVALPTTADVEGEEEATITWVVTNTSYASISEDGASVIGKFDENNESTISAKLSFTIKFKEAEVVGNITIKLNGKKNTETNAWENKENAITAAKTVEVVKPIYSYELKDEFINNTGNELFKFSWTEAEAEEINSSLSKYFSVDSSDLELNSDPTKLYESYTIEPVQMGNYYFLMLKLKDVEAKELFKKDADGNIVKDDKGNVTILDQELYDEIVAAKTEALLTDNAIKEMIYENRYDHNMKIFDAYIEALYEYEYNYFYEQTLSLTKYNEFSKTTKNKKEVIVSFQTKAGDKNSVVEIKAIDLFKRLESKYASSSVATLVENYILISDKKYNNIYNPYNDKILDEEAYHNLMNSEVSTIRKNFEKDYFAYEYLAYYGFTPNFPSEYGWKQFIKDYFVAYSDQELLTASTYGGTIYSDALTKFTDDAYDFKAIAEKMNAAQEDWYSVSVVNLLITIDTNYNANDSSSDSATIILAETDNWEFDKYDANDATISSLAKKQNDLAIELADFMYEVANQTNAATIADQLTELVTLYKDAAYEHDATAEAEAKKAGKSIYEYNYFGKYKLAGLNVKVEKAATYDSSSSIMEEFSDVCKALWKDAAELGLLDKTFDVPLLSEAFHTDYGYHKVAVLSAKDIEELPTEEEIEIHRAQAFVTSLEEEIKTVKENIDTYSASGYNVSTYEAEKAFLENKLAKYEAELQKVLTKYNKASDYELDEEAAARITAWYTPAEEAIEGGTLVTRQYLDILKTNIDSFKFETAGNKDKMSEFIEILLAECDRQDAEE